MDIYKLLNYGFSKTRNNFNYRIAIKKLNDKFAVLCHFLSPKTTPNNKVIELRHFLNSLQQFGFIKLIIFQIFAVVDCKSFCTFIYKDHKLKRMELIVVRVIFESQKPFLDFDHIFIFSIKAKNFNQNYSFKFNSSFLFKYLKGCVEHFLK